MEFEKHFCKQKSLASLSRTLLANFALANLSLALLSTLSYAEQSQNNAQSTNGITLDNIGGGGGAINAKKKLHTILNQIILTN